MGSPIEEQLFEALLAAAVAWCWQAEEWPIPGCEDPRIAYLSLDDSHHAFVVRGVPLLTYRADFLMFGQGAFLAIECDGHDFHDRTKQQAAYDRARDRELLLKKGVTTIRFTGSEIFHSVERCANEALYIFRALVKRATPEVALDITGAVGG